jgi:hypothetical protein
MFRDDFFDDEPYWSYDGYPDEESWGPPSGSERHNYEVEVIALTKKGLLIAPGGDAPSGWYPRSYVTLEGGTGPTVLSIPDWLIGEKRRSEIKFDAD